MTMTALATPRLGLNSHMYRNTGTYGTPTWAELKNAKDVKIPHSYAGDDVSARLTGGFEASVSTLGKISVSFTMFDDDGADITAIRTAYYGRSVIELAVLNGLISDANARGHRGFYQVTKFDETQGNDKAVSREVELTLTWPDPAAVTAGAGSAQAFSGTGS